MKKLLTVIATLSLFAVLGAGTARAQVVYGIKADIPFDFTVKNTTLPAGRYAIKPFGEMPQSLMAIVSEEGKILAVFSTEDAQMTRPPQNSELIFHRLGDHYFLYEVFEQGEGIGAMIPKPRAERRLEKEEAVNAASSYVTVVATGSAARR